MNSKKIQKITAAAIALLVLVYVGYQIYIIQNKGIKTETAMFANVSDTVQTTGFAVRKEIILDNAYNGVLSYYVTDGARVSQGGVIADIFASESDAAAQVNIRRVNNEIENLNLLSGPTDYFASDPSLISTQIYSALNDIFDEERNRDFSKIAALKETLQVALNRKQLITGEENSEDYKKRIEVLQNEKNKLTSVAADKIDSVLSPAAGYFISSTDGFENAVDLAKIKKVTVNEIKQLQADTKKNEKPQAASIGKICGDFSWYLLCTFKDSEMTKFENVKQVYLDIPFASTGKIPAEIVARNHDAQSGETAVVFECSYMDSGIALLRNESVKIEVNDYSGVLVKKEALHYSDVEYTKTDEDGNETTEIKKDVKGVYVEYGGRLKFVQVFTDKTVNGYAICKTELNEEEQAALVTDSTIQLYDEVVMEGTDLYDGKLVR